MRVGTTGMYFYEGEKEYIFKIILNQNSGPVYIFGCDQVTFCSNY
jgi:hypothetical protein